MTTPVDLASVRAQFHLPDLQDPDTWFDFDITYDQDWREEDDTTSGAPGTWYAAWDNLHPADGDVAARYYVGDNLATLTEELTRLLRGALPVPGSPIKVRVCGWALRYAPPQALRGAA